MRARTLIVNGDDFGLTPGVNAGILDAHRDGILTSASLFANAAATDDAVKLARRIPTLGIGCHLVLVDGTPVLPAVELPTLTRDGRFLPTWGAFIRRAIRGRLSLVEVERELTAQIDRLASEGLPLTHLDGHKHVHAFPPVFDIVARLARRFGIRAVRVPCERPALPLLYGRAASSGTRRQALENVALVPWARRDGALLARHDLPPAPWFRGRVLTGLFTSTTLHRLLSSLPEGVSELMMHPGYVDEPLGRLPTRLQKQREQEVSLLTEAGTIEAIRRAKVDLARHDGSLVPLFAETERHASCG